MTATMTGVGSNTSARSIIEATLAGYGLGSLASWAWEQYLGGSPTEKIMLDIRQRPEYKARFPAMEDLAKKGHAMTEAQYVNYEQSATGIMRAAGLPAGFYNSPDDFATLLRNEVSISELTDRISKSFVEVATAPAVARKAFSDFYGPGSDQALAAYFLDPTKAAPVLERQVAAAQVAGEARGLGLDVSQGLAEQAGASGIPSWVMRSDFANLPSGITRNTVGEQQAGQGLTADQAVGAALGIAENQPLKWRIQNRVGAAQGTGAAAETQTGVIGAGAAQKG